MTLKEIAEMAGVSQSTVSRVISKNSDKYASKEVQDRIWDIVQKTGYEPNRFAQGLRLSSKSEASENDKGIACIFGRIKDFYNDQFFSSIFRAAEQETYKHEHTSIRYALSFSQLNNSQYVEMVENTQVSGAIIMGRCNKNLMQFLLEHYKNIVYVGLNSVDFPIDQVICNGYYISAEAVKYLNLLGHTSIGYIGEVENEIRYKGYYDQLAKLKLKIDRDFIADVPLTAEGGYRGAKELLSGDKRPTGIFCCNDNTALGAVKAIKEMKFKIPEDVSIISTDNIEMAQYVTPMLTTVSVPKDEMGKMAVKLLLDRIKSGHVLPVRMDLPFKIVQRESCCRK